MRLDRLPLTYDECRARFRHAAAGAGHEVRNDAITARGPHGQELTVDSVWIGGPRPTNALTISSGVHGVEGFIGSALQTDLLGRLDPASLPDGTGVLVIHAVNPWGMAWGRRQNEHNVDLNRNWRRDHVAPPANAAYDEIHALACPDTDDLPDVGDLMDQATAMIERRGLAWLRDGITRGQYTHPDGLHYGGERTEESNLIVEALVGDHLSTVERHLALDLHTGHGPWGEVTFLSDQPPGSDQHAFLTETFPGLRVEATEGNPDATTGTKVGQVANGMAALLPAATRCVATSCELGTAPDEEQLVATYHEQWVHRRGDRSVPAHAAAAWRYRCCFTPDDRGWEATALTAGRDLVDRAVARVAGWR